MSEEDFWESAEASEVATVSDLSVVLPQAVVKTEAAKSNRIHKCCFIRFIDTSNMFEYLFDSSF